VSVSYDELYRNMTKDNKKILMIISSQSNVNYKFIQEKTGLKQRSLDIAIAELIACCIIEKYKLRENYRETYFKLTRHGIEISKLL